MAGHGVALGIPHRIADTQLRVRRLGLRNHAVGVFEGQCQRLLDEGSSSGPHCREQGLGVGPFLSRDDDAVDVVVQDGGVGVGGPEVGSDLSGELLCPLFIEIGDGEEVDGRVLRGQTCPMSADLAGADDRHSEALRVWSASRVRGRVAHGCSDLLEGSSMVRRRSR